MNDYEEVQAPYGLDEWGEPLTAEDAEFEDKPIVKMSSHLLFLMLRRDLESALALGNPLTLEGLSRAFDHELYKRHREKLAELPEDDQWAYSNTSNAVMWGARRVFLELLTNPEAMKCIDDARNLIAKVQGGGVMKKPIDWTEYRIDELLREMEAAKAEWLARANSAMEDMPGFFKDEAGQWRRNTGGDAA